MNYEHFDLITDNLGTMTTEKRFSQIARNYPSFQEINPVKLNAYK